MSTISGAIPLESQTAKLAELLRDIRVAMLTTFPSDKSRPHARPMYTQGLDPATFDGTLWFMTDGETTKVHELAQNAAVLVVYAAPNLNRYVVVNGTARAEQNVEKARELWGLHAKGWWPNGPEDPNLRLIRVQVDEAEFWDGPSSTSYFISLAKALVTGERIETTGQHGTLRT